MRIEKDNLEYLEYDPIQGLLTIKWWVGGCEGAVNGLTFKVECVKEHISNYKSPDLPYRPDLLDRW